jgi:hypothetical protein
MSLSKGRVAATALLLMMAVGVGVQPRVLAQAPDVPPLHCGPLGVLRGDLVAINVSNTGQGVEPVVASVRLLDTTGSPLLDRTITLATGHSISVSTTLANGGLVRGEIATLSGPSEPRLRATLQVLDVGGDLTYGPNVQCSGQTANRGPV